ncbi:MAG: hypothetical protein A2284_04265 [Deltaproteobacteria bacterium RIFOXYA12_FULL_61_11]|nr:MAG: hypothetical protein A2284_04265 [Deltaproteobacteria bacterium RIFOXYA12_FULL_61_11]
MRTIPWILLLASLSVEASAERPLPWLCRLTATTQDFDDHRPWIKADPVQRSGAGVVIRPGLVLTTASLVRSSTYIRVFLDEVVHYTGLLERVDFYTDLALVRVEDGRFARSTSPIHLDPALPVEEDTLVAHWLEGQTRRSDRLGLIRCEPEWSTFGGIKLPACQLEAKSSGVPTGSPVSAGNRILGIISGYENDALQLVPSRLIEDRLAEFENGKDRGFARLGVRYQEIHDPTLATHLGLPGEPAGVLLREVVPGTPAHGVLLPGDILLRAGGFALDSSGMYRDPVFGPIPFGGYLNHWNHRGQSFKVTVFRGGRELELTIPWKTFEYRQDLVPQHALDPQPRYAVRGGLVFRELDLRYLEQWQTWWKSAPPRLRYLADRSAPQDDLARKVVIITHILPDDYTSGYENLENEVIAGLNGRPVHGLDNILTGFEHPLGDFHVLELETPAGRRVVLDGRKYAEAQRRILDHYHIDQPEHAPGVDAGR